MKRAPYGSWISPISSSDVVADVLEFGEIAFADDGSLWWAEARPVEDGRTVIVRRATDGTIRDAVPEGFDVRTVAHEYGGGAWTPVRSGLVAVRSSDQRLYLLSPQNRPVPLTPQATSPHLVCYADLVPAPSGDELFCVREYVLEDVINRDIVAIPLDGSCEVHTLVVDGHFLSSPRPAPGGRGLCWLTWDHPRMPWDGTELRIGDLDGRMVHNVRTVLGGTGESIYAPVWVNNETLHVVSDRTGWWNLYRVTVDGQIRPLCPMEEEFGFPQWAFGSSTHTSLADGTVAVLHGRGQFRLGRLNPTTGRLDDLDVPCDWRAHLAAHDSVVAGVAGDPAKGTAIVTADFGEDGTTRAPVSTIRSSHRALPDPRYLPQAREEELKTGTGRNVYVLIYSPRNPDFVGLPAEKPPYIAFVHGGPTSRASISLDLTKAYFTSRGIGVMDVNYGGSIGYGRAYRERLRGKWGVVDVEDVTGAMSALAAAGEADPSRLLIRGNSAGGWTALSALARSEVFAGGTSYYGVADATSLAAETHDFESHYLDGLIGPLPHSAAIYRERSPATHLSKIRRPILLLHGSRDRVVPPNQSESVHEALVANGVPHAYLLFDSEEHGFHRADSKISALEAELSFYGQVCGFEPRDVPRLRLEP